MNKIVLKQTALLSAILGAIIGVLTLIPFVRNFSFMVLLMLVSAIVIIYMKKNDLIGIIDIKEGALLGGVIGFVSYIAFSIVFAPLAIIISFILPKTYIGYIAMFFKSLPFIISIMLTLFGGILSALMNAFTGLTTTYVYEILSGIKKEENENVDFEIKE